MSCAVYSGFTRSCTRRAKFTVGQNTKSTEIAADQMTSQHSGVVCIQNRFTAK